MNTAMHMHMHRTTPPAGGIRLWVGRTVALLAAALAVLVPASPAAAHVTITPERAAPGAFTAYTLTVPNEADDQATIEVRVTLPAGFALDSAEAVPGWTTTVTRRPDGTAAAVRWSGGRIPPGTFATFGLRGRNPATAGALTWPIVQRDERRTVAWTGPPDADTPAATTAVGAAGPPAAPAPADDGAGPPAQGAAPPAGQGVDELARSRAALALALSAAAVLLAVGMAVSRRRRGAGHDGRSHGAASEDDLKPR